MRKLSIVTLALVALLAAACTGDDPELTTESTIVTEPTEAPAVEDTTTTTTGAEETATPTTLVGQAVSEYEVVDELPNDTGVEQHIVIPNGAYTDIDLQNFILDLLDSNPDLFGAEVFDDVSAAEAFLVDETERSEDEVDLLDRHWFVTLTGRERIDFRGPFAEFPGWVIGS